MIPLFKVFMNPDTGKEVSKVLTSGYITQGAKVEEFENSLKKWFNYEYILTVNSATSGLTLALRLCNLSMGDKVLSTPLTCFATNASILANNLDIKWLDVDINTGTIDMEDLQEKINYYNYIKVLMLVHWGGFPVDLKNIRNIVPKDVTLIEDCAHAFGAEYEGEKLGAHCSKYNSICVFSLQAIKHLTTGDGGLIFLPNKEMYERAKLLRWYGIDRQKRSSNGDFRLENDIIEWGYKFHMNDINATIGLCNLPYIEENLIKIRNNVEYYNSHLREVNGVEMMLETPNSVTAGWIYTIKIIGKPKFIEYMKKKCVTVSQVHQRNDINYCVKKYVNVLNNLDKLEKFIISIPCGWWLTNQEREYIVTCIKEWCNIFYPRDLLVTDYHKGFLSLYRDLNGVELNYSFDEFKQRFEKMISQNSKIIVIENENQEIIATGKILVEHKFFDSICHIEDVVVRKDYQRCGFGDVIINRLIEETNSMRKEGNSIYKIVLECTYKLENFYKSNGFINKGYQMMLKL